MPDISVVIPTYNRKGYLKQALASCFAGNEDIDVEVVVVDDGSTDGTHEYLQSLDNPNVRPIFQEHQGGQVARNLGLEEAQGTYIKFLDDDDWLAEGTLTKEVSVLKSENVDMCTGGCQFVDADEEHIGSPHFPRFDNLLVACFKGFVGPQPIRHTYRRSFASSLEWDERLPCRQDYAFVTGAALKSPIHVHSNVMTGSKRQHEGGLSKGKKAKEKDCPGVHLRIIKDAARTLLRREENNPVILKAAQEGLWTWGRLRAVKDWESFVNVYKLVRQIDSSFLPNRKWKILHWCDRLWGPPRTEQLILPLRKFAMHL